MAFEDHYYRSRNFGSLNLRYRPADPRYLPAAAIGRAQEIPGFFCVAQASVKQGVQYKKCLSAQKFSDIKPMLLKEMRVSLDKMSVELARVVLKEQALLANPNTPSKYWENFIDDERTPVYQTQRAAHEMIDAITHWTYEENLCNKTALTVHVVEVLVCDETMLSNE